MIRIEHTHCNDAWGRPQYTGTWKNTYALFWGVWVLVHSEKVR